MNCIYHITFKMEGPKADILRLTRFLHRITVWRGDFFRWIRRHPSTSAENSKPLAEIFATLQSEVTGRSVENLSDGWQVLTFEVRQEYPEGSNISARTEFWQTLQQRLLPEGTCYYRVTDIGRRRIYTNDVHGKYFPEKYMLCVMHDAGCKSAELAPLRQELLRDKYVYWQQNGHAMYLSYWGVNSLRCLLREALGMRRLAPIDERHVLWQKAWEWSTDLGFSLIWGIVERRADGKMAPCRHCRKIHDLQVQNKQLRAEIIATRRRIDDTIRKLQRYAASTAHPAPHIVKALAKSQKMCQALKAYDAQVRRREQLQEQ